MISEVKEHIVPGAVFRHYKGKDYRVITLSCHAEDLTWYVVYETLHHNETSSIWHRPLDLFLGTVDIDGGEVRRFTRVF